MPSTLPLSICARACRALAAHRARTTPPSSMCASHPSPSSMSSFPFLLFSPPWIAIRENMHAVDASIIDACARLSRICRALAVRMARTGRAQSACRGQGARRARVEQSALNCYHPPLVLPSAHLPSFPSQRAPVHPRAPPCFNPSFPTPRPKRS